MVAFDRLLTRLAVVAPDRWILKGGVALDLRLGDRARQTRDLDLVRHDNEDIATEDLLTAANAMLEDFFEFAVEQASDLPLAEEAVAVRYQINVALAGRRFERIRLDIGFGAPPDLPPDRFRLPELLEFAGIAPVEVPTLPLEFHVAEKLHAYTRSYGDKRPNARVKDLIDLVLIRSVGTFPAGRLRAAIATTFVARSMHSLPTTFSHPPQDWVGSYRRLAIEVGQNPDIAIGHRLVAEFLDPVLDRAVGDADRWDPDFGVWQPSSTG
jgi:hypothetical protein